MNNKRLFDQESTVIFYNLKVKAIQSMLDFDFLSQRKPSIAAIVHSGRKGLHKAFFGQKEILIPIYDSLAEAVEKNPGISGMINFASFRSAYEITVEALDYDPVKTIVIVAEGMPEQQARKLISLASEKGKQIIGPATVGGIIAGKFRMGYAGGSNENIIQSKLYQAGSVGLVSKSGGMLNELFSIISRSTDGIFEGISIGGDAFPGSTLLDHVLRFEQNQEIKMIVVLGEIGGRDEYELAKAKKEGKISKPTLCYVAGTCAKIFPGEVQFGHAGAFLQQEDESADAKNKALREAGFLIPSLFEELEGMIKDTFHQLKKEGKISEREEQKIPIISSSRRETTITSTISSDLGEEPTYGTTPISTIIEQQYSLGEIISLLWFKKKLPQEITKFFELVLTLCADHGPAVSGAHNAIVASRAGKDIISALCSGLLTIGPRFGGAIDDACRAFLRGYNDKINSADLVDEFKQQGIPFPGIGHRIKSIHNPDKRVELLKNYAQKHFLKTTYLDYALQIEKVTLQKADNLILNVDGCIAAAFLDALTQAAQFSTEEIKEIVELGYMNGLFALARSIGIIGHALDQKRLGAGLYRHPQDDIFYAL